MRLKWQITKFLNLDFYYSVQLDEIADDFKNNFSVREFYTTGCFSFLYGAIIIQLNYDAFTDCARRSNPSPVINHGV